MVMAEILTMILQEIGDSKERLYVVLLSYELDKTKISI